MKKIIILMFLIIIIMIGCPIDPEQEENNKSRNVVLFSGKIDDTFFQNFNKTNNGLVNEIIQVQFTFSDPEIFDGLLTLYKDGGQFDTIVISNLTNFTVIKNIDLTSSDYFQIDSEFENDPNYDDRELDCVITWIKK